MAEFLRVVERHHSPEEVIPLELSRLYLDELLNRDHALGPELVDPAAWELIIGKYPDKEHLIRGITFSITTANRHRRARPAQRAQMERLFLPQAPFPQVLMADLLAARFVVLKRRSVEQEATALRREVHAVTDAHTYALQTIFGGIITERIMVPIPAA